MKISVYTTANDAIENEFTLFEGVKQAQTFADEIIYVDGGSKDGTLQWMKKLASYDKRLKIYENPWPVHMHKAATVIQKNFALSKCTGDWCMLMDADEVYSDDLVEIIRKWISFAEEDSNNVALYCHTRHFFYNYECLCVFDPWQGYSWYPGKIYVVKNNLGIHHGNADGDHDGFVDNDDKTVLHDLALHVGVNHYGHVRSDEIYSKKKNAIERRYHPDWQDVEYTLAIKGENCFEPFRGQHPQSMLERVKLPIPLQHKDVLNYYQRLLNWDS